MNKLHEYLLSSIKKVESEGSNSAWKVDSKFRAMRNLQIDLRGNVGEEFLSRIFKNAGYNVEYPRHKTGDWDIKINDFKIEVKTATLDVNDKFQHEGLKRDGDWDIAIFVDIAPEEIFVSIYKKDEIEWDKLHLRGKQEKATGAGHKWDFKRKELKEHINENQIVMEFEKKTK